MDIISFRFVFIAILTALIYYLLQPKFRVAFLTIISCGFIATYSYTLLVYILIYSSANYFIGLRIPVTRHKLLLFRTGVILNIAQLILLRYSTFAIDPVLQFFHSNIHISDIYKIIIPLGVSYFSLQGIGYLINIKMGWEKPERNFIHFLLYIVFYPKYMSGPIERSNHFLPQLNDLKSFNRLNITGGLRLVLLGLIEKNVIANQLSLVVSPVYNDISTYDGNTLLLVILIQPLYVYFDFSGYTDIARGIAKMYGITLLPNFERPFFAENVTNFWKRFHMSLAFWFNDYVFKQLSFKLRKWKTSATVFAVFVTWTLFGIWHGAGWNFMALGVLQALVLNFEFFTRGTRQKYFSLMPDLWRKWIGRVITYLFYGVSLVFFFSPDLKTTLYYFDGLKHINFSFHISQDQLKDNIVTIVSYSLTSVTILILLTIEMLSVDMKKTYHKIELLLNSDVLKHQAMRYIIYYLALLLMFYFGGMQTEYIYLQF